MIEEIRNRHKQDEKQKDIFGYCMVKAHKDRGDLLKKIEELESLLKECRKVMKADNLHRGNPNRRGLWSRITTAIKGVVNDS